MKDIKSKYKTYDPRVIEFISSVYEDCNNNNDHLNNYFFCCLDLLANQLKLYFFALDSIDADSKISTQDAYKRISKNPAITVLNKAHQEIINILSKLSLSPFDRAKLKRVQTGDEDMSAEKLVNELIA